MKKYFTSNLFCILLIYGGSILLEIFTVVDGLYLMQILTIWIVVVAFHEIGHWYFARLRGMRLSFISTMAGMYMNGRWYFRIPMYFSFGAMLAYKPLYKGKISGKDIIILNLGGAIFNLIAASMLLILKFVFGLDSTFLNWWITFNLVITLVTLLPGAADGKSIWNLARGSREELLFYDSMNYLYDTRIDYTKILEDIEEDRDIIANYARNVAFIEKNISSENMSEIYKTTLSDIEKTNENLINAFQYLYKAADGKLLSEEEIELFNEVNSSVYMVFGKIYEYFTNDDIRILQRLLEHKTWMPSDREDKILYAALNKMVMREDKSK